MAARTLTVVTAVVLAVGDACGAPRAAPPPAAPAPGATAPAVAAPATSAPPPPAPPPIDYPERGGGTWTIAPGAGEIAGTRGRVMRYRVAVENGIRNLAAAEFAGTVGPTLADARG